MGVAEPWTTTIPAHPDGARRHSGRFPESGWHPLDSYGHRVHGSRSIDDSAPGDPSRIWRGCERDKDKRETEGIENFAASKRPILTPSVRYFTCPEIPAGRLIRFGQEEPSRKRKRSSIHLLRSDEQCATPFACSQLCTRISDLPITDSGKSGPTSMVPVSYIV